MNIFTVVSRRLIAADSFKAALKTFLFELQMCYHVIVVGTSTLVIALFARAR